MTSAPPRILIALVVTATVALAQNAEYALRPTSPGARSLLAWDSDRGRVVAIETTPQARLWDWDGTTWSHRFGAPSGGTMAPFAAFYDDQRGAVVAMTVVGTNVGQERAFDGARWSIRSVAVPSGTPGAVFWANTFDSVRRRLVTTSGSDVLEWDGTQWNLLTPSNSPGTRNDAALGYDPVLQRTLLYGGLGQADCWSWDGSAWTLLHANAAPGARSGASFAFEPSTARMILHGGDVAQTTWALQGTTWTQVATSRAPALRTRPQWVWDGTGLLLFGGSTTEGGTLWRFQNNDWFEIAGGSPMPRNESAFVWDVARGQAVLFGGYIGNPSQPPFALFGDTWTFDGRWQHHATPVAPAAGAYVGAWSATDGGVLLFGGTFSGAGTWIWNGSTWAQRNPIATPPWRFEHGLAADPTGGVLLFGGSAAGTTPLGDQWLWNGTNWLQQTPAVMPSPRRYPLMTLDPVRNVTVLASGYDFTTNLTDTWEWNGTSWTQRASTPFMVGSRTERICFRPDTARVLVESYGQWEWDGTTWFTGPTTNSSIAGLRIVADTVRNRVLRFPLQNATSNQDTGLGVLTTTPANGERYGNGCAIGSAPGLLTSGRPSPGEPTFGIEATTFAPGALTVMAIGFQAQNQPLGSGCNLLVGAVAATQWSLANATGRALMSVPIPLDNGLRGVELFAQAAVVDPARALFGGLTISDALRITIGD